MRTDSTDRRETSRWAREAIVPLMVAAAMAVVSVLAATQVLAGQEQATSSGWLPWTGCWEAVGDFGQASPASDIPDAPGIPGDPDAPGTPDDSAASDAPGTSGTVTCVRPGDDGLGAEILTVEGGEEPGDPEVLRADGRQRSSSREGCEGWESAEFSRDGARVYLSSEYTCRGGVQRVSTGIFSLVSPYEWLDVRSVESGGEVRTWTRRYLRLQPDEVERPGLEAWAEAEQELALETARIALSAAPSLEDVVEASSRVHEEAVVAWLAEEGDPIEVEGDVLVELAEAGVPGQVTDMLVALDNPDRFVVGTGGEVEAQDPFDGRRGYASYRPSRRIVSGIGFRGPWGYRSGFGFYGRYRYDPFYRPWGYGGYGYTYRPAIIYVQPRAPRDSGGRIVRGQGYTRPGSSDGSRTGVSRPSGSSRSPGSARAPSRGGSDRGGSVSSSGGYRGGSSSGSTGRTARPRGDGDGGN